MSRGKARGRFRMIRMTATLREAEENTEKGRGLSYNLSIVHFMYRHRCAIEGSLAYRHYYQGEVALTTHVASYQVKIAGPTLYVHSPRFFSHEQKRRKGPHTNSCDRSNRQTSKLPLLRTGPVTEVASPLLRSLSKQPLR